MNATGPTNQTILVTGGAGFIGSHLVEALAPENEVRVLDSLVSGTTTNLPDDATLIEGDVRDSDTLKRATEDVDLIYHEAALVSVQRSIDTPVKSHEVNVDATLSLLERARELDARLVLASSAAIYGHPDQVPITESAGKVPTSPYGLDKLTIDHAARLYHDLYGVETVALRYFNVYGPRQPPNDYSGVISIFLERAVNDEPITIFGDGGQTRDFVFVDDVVQANLRAAETDHVGEGFNVATGQRITIRELAEEIVDITDSNSEIVHTEPRSGDIRHSQADISNIEAALEFEPTADLREGLEQTVEWFTTRE